ncbi:LptA/OstA family protein [Deinococcus sp.]|uniref:LptA/OstA family protein n=1 Tax=Deinococcus sp. TaxID=47478 RepID=UPI00286DF86E|nr:LptA/OstA family protein [Deinococcus sp.]
MNRTQTRVTVLLSALIGTTLAVAATAPINRVLKFETSAQLQGDLRNGPYNYTGKAGAAVKATVGTVSIAAPQASMKAPAGTPMANAQGRRSADFTGGVTVLRGRLSAKGAALNYSEASGQGLLTGAPSAVFTPEKKGDDPVNIAAANMSLDVDTNMSTSTGNVKLVSGVQTGRADRVVFDEGKELGLLTGNMSLSRAATAKAKELNVVGTEARILTKGKLLYVLGKVKLTQGSTTTTGDAVYYDDARNVAYVVGNAVSTDSKTGTTVRARASGALEQRTDLGRVRAVDAGFTIPTAQFKLSGEK